MKRLLAFSALALALSPLLAQDKKPAPAKDRVSEARAALNEAKQDNRNKDRIKEAEAALRKALKNSDAAKAEIDRMKKTETVPDGKDAKATLQKLKDSVDKNDLKELENLLKESTDSMKEEIKAYQQKRREEAGRNPAPNGPAPAMDPPPVSFKNVAPPSPAGILRGPDIPRSPMVTAKHGFICGERDPRNPDVILPPNDPRRRMWVLSGNVRVRRPFLALDADEVDLYLREGEGPDLKGLGSGKSANSAPSADPSGRPRPEEEPFERIVARGNVKVMFVDRSGVVKVARGGSMIYEARTGVFIIKEWPEAELGNKLISGPEKSSVIRLSNIQAEEPDVEIHGLKAETMETKLTAEDLPRTAEQPVPTAKGRPASAPPPAAAPSPAPR